MAQNPSTIIIGNMPLAPDVQGADMFMIQRGTTPGAYMRMTAAMVAAYIGAGGGTWGSITGTLSAQTDLQNALNLKANTSALSAVAFSGLYSDLSGAPLVPTLTSQLTNDSGFITSSALSPYLTSATAASTYATQASLTSGLAGKYDASNPTGFITSAALSGYLLSATAASTYATISNLALKAPINSPTFTGTVSGITATMVGLGNVNNTSDANKPVSTAQQAALDLKYDASNPVGYITSSALSGYLLASTAASTYATISNLALKAPLASPTFTGTVSGITAAMVGAPSGSGTSTGTNTGDQTSVTGNAGTATALQTPRNINGVAFDGSANITVTAAASTLSGTTLASGVTASSLTSVGTQAQALNMGSHLINNVTDPVSAQDAATKNYVDNAVLGLLDYRGSHDASTNLYPASGGSGLAGAVLKGDFWICSVAGTLGGTSVTPGDLIIAIIDTPAQTSANWDLIPHSLGSSGGVTTGQIVIDFGAFPGSNEASVDVTGQTAITSAKLPRARYFLATTSDHTINDHTYAAMLTSLTCSVPTDGVGFTIFARSPERLQGTFNLNWTY